MSVSVMAQQELATLLLETGSLLSVSFQVRLTGQGDPGIHMFLPLWGHNHSWVFTWVLGLEPGLQAFSVFVFPTEPSPQALG